jgi:hypothetical protein
MPDQVFFISFFKAHSITFQTKCKLLFALVSYCESIDHYNIFTLNIVTYTPNIYKCLLFRGLLDNLQKNHDEFNKAGDEHKVKLSHELIAGAGKKNKQYYFFYFCDNLKLSTYSGICCC